MRNFFIKDGKNSLDYGIHIPELPSITRARERVEVKTALGRSGSLIIREGTEEKPVHDRYIKTFEIVIKDNTKIETVAAWLTGCGEFIFSNELNRKYMGYISEQFELSRMFRAWHKGVLSIEVDPYKYAVPSAADVKFLKPGGIIENPGTVYALPVITVSGSGSGTISINGDDHIINPITDGMVINSDTMQVFKDSTNLNEALYSDDFPWLKVGRNNIVLNGGITQIMITPRWRYL